MKVIILFIFAVATLPFKAKLFQALYPKPSSLAVDPIDDLTNQLLQASTEFKMALAGLTSCHQDAKMYLLCKPQLEPPLE